MNKIIALLLGTLAFQNLVSAELSYLSATLKPEVSQHFARQEVRLYPGWKSPLAQSVVQTMVPEVIGDFKPSIVRVVPGRQVIEDNEDIHALVYFQDSVETVTIYIQHSIPADAFPSSNPTSGPTSGQHLEAAELDSILRYTYVHGIIYPTTFQEQNMGEVFLSPVWRSKLEKNITLLMEPAKGSKFTKQYALAVPGWVNLQEADAKKAFHAQVVLPNNFHDQITIYP